ncbi:crystallin gamma N [Cricetulus griseus]
MLFVFDKVEQSWLCDLRLLAECLELNGRPLPTPLLWDPQVRRGVVRPDAADSVMSESLMAPKITLYEGKHFTGRKLEVFGDCDNFQDRGFMNRVNSIRVESGAWVCFDHPDFRGQQFILEHGDYPEFFRWNGHNDHMGSCRPVGMVNIFEGCNFTGQCLEFVEDCPFLQSRGWAKSCVNAIKVYGDGAWVLYEEPNYRGRMYVVERGDFRSFSDWEAHSARVQSLRRVLNFF